MAGAPAKALAAPAIAARALAVGGERGGTALIRVAQDFGYAAEDAAATQEERTTAT